MEGDWVRRQLEGDWIRKLLMEELEATSVGRGLDPDVVDGRGLDPTSVGRGSDPEVVDGRIGSNVSWKGIGSGCC